VNNGSISPIDMISFVKMEEAPIMDSGLFGFSLRLFWRKELKNILLLNRFSIL